MANDGLISRIYSSFRGVDFRGEEINIVRSPNSLNIWKDYKEVESIRTRPEMELLSSFTDTIYGIFFYRVGDTEMMIVHSGTKLYKVVNGTKTVLYEGVNSARSDAFIYNNLWYFKDGANYLQYDGTSVKDVSDVAHIPTTTIGRKAGAMGGGTTHEDVNLLTPYRTNTFIGDGKSNKFYLDVESLPISMEDEENGTLVETRDCSFSVNGVEYTNGGGGNQAYNLSFGTTSGAEGFYCVIYPVPPAPLTDGQDNVSITFPVRRKDKHTIKSKIYNCTLLQVFDNRVFFSGNKDYPNMIWHCALNDPTYCSDLDYYNEGLDTAEVKGMVAGNNVLWVFKEPSQANTTVFYHTPTIDAEYGKIYPNTHSSIATGCVGKAINFNDDIIFFSDRGMEGISGDITTEQVIAHRSSLVDRKLTAESNYKDMILEEWEGYLLAFIDNKVYLADSRAIFTNENHYEYEWFYWCFDKKITCAKVNKGILYLGTNDGVYTLTDTTSNVESYWVTPKDKFKYPQYLKTTNKRGCVIESTGDVSVYAKTEKTDFELIGEYKNITDAFVCRIKRKKWKDIQLKFYSKTRFSLETATLEAFVGGYIKR